MRPWVLLGTLGLSPLDAAHLRAVVQSDGSLAEVRATELQGDGPAGPEPVPGSFAPGETACVNDPAWTRDGKTCNDFSATECQASLSQGDHALHNACCASCAGDENKCSVDGDDCPTGAVCGATQLCELAACVQDNDCKAHADDLVCGAGHCRVALPTGRHEAPSFGWQGESACVNDPAWEQGGKRCSDFSPDACEQRFAAGDKTLQQACCATCAGTTHKCTADGDCPLGAVCGAAELCELAACAEDSDCTALSAMLACRSGHCRSTAATAVGELDLAVSVAGLATLEALDSTQVEAAVRPALATQLNVPEEQVEILEVVLAPTHPSGGAEAALLAVQAPESVDAPDFDQQKKTLCGTGGACDGGNRLYIGPDHKHWQLATDSEGREDTSGCAETCKAHTKCGGFYVQRDRLDASGPPVCYFVVNPGCRLEDDETADCYRYQGAERAEWEAPAVSDKLTISLSGTSLATMEGHPQEARARLVKALAAALHVREDQVEVLKTHPDLLGHGGTRASLAQRGRRQDQARGTATQNRFLGITIFGEDTQNLDVWFVVTPDSEPTEPQPDIPKELSVLHEDTAAAAELRQQVMVAAAALANEDEVADASGLTAGVTAGVLRIKFSLPADVEPHLPGDVAQVLGRALGVAPTSAELRWA